MPLSNAYTHIEKAKRAIAELVHENKITKEKGVEMLKNMGIVCTEYELEAIGREEV
jgi:hypothetical protein